MTDTKHCTTCEVAKPLTMFHKSKGGKFGVRSECKDCRSKKDVERNPELREYKKKAHAVYYQANRERLIQYAVDWKRNNPDKANAVARNYKHLKRSQTSGVGVSLEEWNALCEFYDNKCLACEATDQKLTQDHVRPISKGGLHHIQNLQPLCLSCNAHKYTQEIDYRKEVTVR